MPKPYSSYCVLLWQTDACSKMQQKTGEYWAGIPEGGERPLPFTEEKVLVSEMSPHSAPWQPCFIGIQQILGNFSASEMES